MHFTIRRPSEYVTMCLFPTSFTRVNSKTMTLSRFTVTIIFSVIAIATPVVIAHPPLFTHKAPEVHMHKATQESSVSNHDSTNKLSGNGDLVFQYRKDLSTLPTVIEKGIMKAHGGFAIAPNGEIYFGLEGTGVVRISPDLTNKELICSEANLDKGGIHNTTYLEVMGGSLALPDHSGGQIRIVSLDGKNVVNIGRPSMNPYYRDTTNSFCPTDTAAIENTLFICDGYSQGKYMLSFDLETYEYNPFYFGGASENKGRSPGKFATNHGVVSNESTGTLLVADRERHWLQEFSIEGKFLGSLDADNARVCDATFFSWEDRSLMIAPCLRGKDNSPGLVHIFDGEKIISTIRPKVELGLEAFEHVHDATAVIVEDKLYILCYGWNPGCFAVLEHVKAE